MASQPHPLKNKRKWFVACFFGSVALAGALTDFRFGEINLLLRDSTWHYSSAEFIYHLTAFTAIALMMYWAIKIALPKNPIGALMVALIFPLMLIAGVFYLYLLIGSLRTVSGDMLPRVVPIALLAAAIGILTAIVTLALKSLYTWISSPR